jgi:hypothetical protein
MYPGFMPKRLKPCRVPEKLKAEVSRQIHQVLAPEFIVPPRSKMTSPIEGLNG